MIMRFLFIVIIALGFVSCKREPEFYINGKPYYTENKCIKDTTYKVYGYHFGYHFGKLKWHLGFYKKHKCLEETIDTIPIN
jgi:hypothetical protein